jgi:hypothetical protein
MSEFSLSSPMNGQKSGIFAMRRGHSIIEGLTSPKKIEYDSSVALAN